MSDDGMLIDDIRHERNRFVAFAFAVADAFIETDTDGRIIYATGAIRALTGQSEDEIVNLALDDLVDRRSRSVIRAAHAAAVKQGRVGPFAVFARTQAGKASLIELRAAYLPAKGGRVFIALSRPAAAAGHLQAPREGTEVGGLLDSADFVDTVQTLLAEPADAGKGAAVTLLELSGLSALEAKLGIEHGSELMEDVAAHLQVHAIDASAAGRLTEERFGVVHDPSVNVADLQISLQERVLAADPDGVGVKVEGSTVDTSAGGLSEVENAKALVYTIKRFSASKDEFTVSELAQGYRMALVDTRSKIASFKTAVADANFDVAFQPIVDLRTGQVHHYEALARFSDGGDAGSPAQLIKFAEEAGIIQDFDLAMCRTVAAGIDMAKTKGDDLSIAVNLSGRSLSSNVFLDQLAKLLAKYWAVRDNLSFEITESSEIGDLEMAARFIEKLRALGHRVSLDDFGAGAAAFQYLRVLDVDCVKIDGAYVRESNKSQKSDAFLRSMVGLCRDLNIETVGEMVETEESAQYLRDIGVRFGQGYHFGRPAAGMARLIRKKAS